jgi:hypothetical protein
MATYGDLTGPTYMIDIALATEFALDVSYEHASALVRAHGESGWTARLIPLTVDGLIHASSMAMLGSARRGVRVPARRSGCPAVLTGS